MSHSALNLVDEIQCLAYPICDLTTMSKVNKQRVLEALQVSGASRTESDAILQFKSRMFASTLRR